MNSEASHVGVARRRRFTWLAVGGVALVVVFALFLVRPGRDANQLEPVPKTPAAPVAATPAAAAATAATPSDAAPSTPRASRLTNSLLDREWDALIADGEAAASNGPEAAREFMYRLFAALDRLMPDDRLAVILGFFATGRDVRLGSAFTVGPGGFLQDWPTLRVALFDYLAQRDGTAARTLAATLLQARPAEPGEWTLALRELARGRTATSWAPLVVDRLHAFVSDAAWAMDAPRSWLEGFDVVVAGRSPQFLTDLSALTAADAAASRAAKFAAFLAADRLVLAAPGEMLTALNQDHALFSSQPNVRAGLFARTDVRQPAQLQQLEGYLQRPDVSPQERQDFAGLFPLYDLAVSQNLLTPASTRSMADMLAHDRAALVRIDQWLGQPRLSAWHAALQESRARLAAQLAGVPSP